MSTTTPTREQQQAAARAKADKLLADLRDRIANGREDKHGISTAALAIAEGIISNPFLMNNYTLYAMYQGKRIAAPGMEIPSPEHLQQAINSAVQAAFAAAMQFDATQRSLDCMDYRGCMHLIPNPNPPGEPSNNGKGKIIQDT